MNLHAYLSWMLDDLAYKAPEVLPGVLAQHCRHITGTYPDSPARAVVTAPEPLSDDEMVAAIELCRVVVESPDPEPIKSALYRLRVLLDRIPTSTEGVASWRTSP